ncbi:MAG: hypothetical protein NT016_03985 [Candidatus Aenigmarchaeota archaeon]|nr:hypothetical protein [Candidatus Aenigmarchaeota archaeon]
MDETIKEMRKFVENDHSTIYSLEELKADGFTQYVTIEKNADFTRKGDPGMMYKFSIYKNQGFVYSEKRCVNFKREQ